MAILESDDLSVLRVAISALEAKGMSSRSTLIGLLNHDSTVVRKLAISALYRLCDHSDLIEILSEYLTNRTYYYNVVCWLDRLLYSPDSIRAAYIQALNDSSTNRIFNLIDD